MAQTGTDVVDESSCYLDSGCSTHMTSRKDQFVRINEAAHGRIHFADDNNLIAMGNEHMV